jgi:hypothetical protein
MEASAKIDFKQPNGTVAGLKTGDYAGSSASVLDKAEQGTQLQETADGPDAPTIDQALREIPQAGAEPEQKISVSNQDAPAGPAEEGEHCKVKTLYEGPQKCSCCINWVEEYPDDVKTSAEEERDTKLYAIIVRMRKDHEGGKPLDLHSIVIQSSHLKNLLGEVFEGYQGITTSLKKLVFMSPFHGFYYRLALVSVWYSILAKCFLFRWDRFNELVEQQKDTECLEHARLLQTTLNLELKDRLITAKDLLSQGVTTFEYLWTLFEPGDLIYAFVEDSDRIYLLGSMEYTSSFGQKKFSLNLQFIDWNGYMFGFSSTQVEINTFTGTKPITSLTHYPLKYHENLEGITSKLRERGRKFQDLRGCHYKYYNGPVTFVKVLDLMQGRVSRD